MFDIENVLRLNKLGTRGNFLGAPRNICGGVVIGLPLK
jgi:hypothetical protein